MASDRDVAADLARSLTTLYADASTRLAADIARRVAAGEDSPAWADEKLQALHTLRAWTQNLISQLETDSSGMAAQTLVLAFVRGSTESLDAIARLQLPPEQRADLNRHRTLLARLRRAAHGPPTRAVKTAIDAELQQVKDALPGVHGLLAMMWSLESTLSGTHMPLLRWALDSYRTVVTRASVMPVLGLSSRRRAAQIAWEQLLASGVTGFVDRRGRRWELASYVEMATRTVVHQALRSGRLDQLLAHGYELIRISDSPQECHRCLPWEHAVLRIAGAGTGWIEAEHATRDGERVRVHVAGTLPQAIAAGLFHPNCTHSLAAYLPGVTPDRAPQQVANPQGYADRVRLRELERAVRRAKRQAAAVIDPGARAAADAKVRRAHAAVRAHITATGLLRQRHRERIGTAR
ncbi:phage minor capsid protein [Salinispora vitiensis]|uniref:phage minor capsid protein n=1 Tax=Salinispora vitiensis TaxID=999544 RepID=UPI00037CD558|nr:phage minor capsid protein [Salinispora vitiensis]